MREVVRPQGAGSLEPRPPAPHNPTMRQRRDERRTDLDPPPLHRASVRACAWPGCTAEGEFRAPLSRDDLRSYQWLCLEHIREFNRGWDYFRGMSMADIERHRRDDVTWHRPTWRNGAPTQSFSFTLHDPLGVLGEQEPEPSPPPRRLASKTETMLRRLGLDQRAELADIKRSYKILAKRHHPDLHGGDRQAEERLKLINEAYTYLMHCGAFA
ncbi:MAG: J domain-containing protein [Geminicoccaceae bacterium]|nr:MAG: J domain-containing protein [Geminicoccaceae bacterium]